jgi:AcrR family transcriptional regulator
MQETDERGRAPRSDAGERVREAAYELFSRYGLRAVGVDAVIEQSGVAKMTLYRHFASKEDLILDFLATREQRWTEGFVMAEAERRATEPHLRLLAIFDAFDGWFQRDDFEGCSFINVLLETPDEASPVHRASVEHLANIRAFLARLAREAGIDDPESFAREWHLLMKGSIVAAAEGDRHAARRAQRVGAMLLRERGFDVPVPESP